MEEHDCEEHDTRERFDAVLKEFLSERVEAEGSGWAPVTPEAKDRLGELIHLLIFLKWSEDCDGDVPVRYKLWDRTKDMQDSYWQGIVSKDVPSDGKELAQWLSRLAGNVRNAAEALDREARCLEYRNITVGPEEDDVT